MSRYGSETYTNPNKRLDTINKFYSKEYLEKRRKEGLKNKYGFENYNNQPKKELTCLAKYGVRHTNQVDEIFDRVQKSAMVLKTYKLWKYRGSYELDFILFCERSNICVENAKSIKFVYDGKSRRYFPDFYYAKNNLIIEIKSTYTMNLDLNLNLAKKQSAINAGFNFMFIVDKDYKEFLNLCICLPEPCHGDIIVSWLQENTDE